MPVDRIARSSTVHSYYGVKYIKMTIIRGTMHTICTKRISIIIILFRSPIIYRLQWLFSLEVRKAVKRKSYTAGMGITFFCLYCRAYSKY